MHHYNDPCAETSCILSARRRLFLSRAVCLPSGYDARHCHKIPRKTSAKKMEHSRCRNARNALCQPFLAPQAYQADVSGWCLPETTAGHPSMWQLRVSVQQPTGSKGIRREVRDTQRSETTGGSVGSVTKLWTFDEKWEPSSSWSVSALCCMHEKSTFSQFGLDCQSKNSAGALTVYLIQTVTF